MTTGNVPSYPLTCAYLKSKGVDPGTVCEDGVTETGYFVRTGTLGRTHQPWPATVDGAHVLDLFVQDQQATFNPPQPGGIGEPETPDETETN